MAIITLTTDFGDKDHFVGAIKGQILKQLPDATIVDISNRIKPFHIQETAYVLKNAYPNFPEGSIHLIGVDAEVSPENAHVILELDGQYFVGADNGILSLLISEGVNPKIMEINLPNTSHTAFPTLDVFVPVACHLARGGKPEIIGKPMTALKESKEFQPRVTNNGTTLIGNIIYIDNYGNTVSNIERSLFEAYRNGRDFEIVARTTKIKTIQNTYNGIINYDLPKNQRKGAGDALALFNSHGFLELAIYKSDLSSVGGASTLLGLNYRDVVTINFL
ncbi:MAG: SAM-dependent chlorinase/fluorinase [Bacteroidota bacterium]